MARSSRAGESVLARLRASARSLWVWFWHTPVRAERLAFMRILLGLALITDQLFQLLPNFDEFFGPGGVAPAGLHDRYQLRHWRWTMLFFNTDDPHVLYPAFALWVLATALLLVGWRTRLMNVVVWLLTMCWVNRNPNILNGGDDTMQVALFLLMLSPSGKALSLDSWLRRRRAPGPPGPGYTVAWPVRVIQIQLCLIYLSTGLVKLKGEGPGPFKGTWWDGTSIHYVFNYLIMSRRSYVQWPGPLPFWVTAPMTYLSVWWEVLFTPLVTNRWTRKWTLWFGVLFHLGIWLTIEVGWFTFYTWVFYAVWVPDSFWKRLDDWRARRSRAGAAAAPVAATAEVAAPAVQVETSFSDAKR